ncbi:MAG TPA: LysR family transcriptional regulator [Polyangiaceae bacterium]|nr:LysR family transcriptional regulator [Polyangiaceae bacterium]
MDLNRAATFMKVVEEGGFTAAARALELPKSSVSRSVSLFEEELGVLLLRRSTRRVELTEAGRLFYERASHALAGLEDAQAAVADLQGSLKGTVRVTAPSDAGVWILGPLVARFVEEHPGVHVDVLLSSRVVDLVAEGVDFALRAAQITDTNLVARRLAPRDSALYASPRYLAKRGTPSRPAELSAHDCVIFRGDRGRAQWLLSGPRGDEVVEVRGRITADDFVFVHQAVVCGLGVGMMPSFLAAPSVARGELVEVLPSYRGFRGTWHLVYPSARYLPRRAVAFRDLILAELGAPASEPVRSDG